MIPARFAFGLCLLVLGTGRATGQNSASDQVVSDSDQIIPLDYRFDRVRFIPGDSGDVLLIPGKQSPSGPDQKPASRQLVRFSPKTKQAVKTFPIPAVVDLVIDDVGTFAYLIPADAGLRGQVWRLDLSDGSTIPSQGLGEVGNAELTFYGKDQLLRTLKDQGVVAVGNLIVFNSELPGPSGPE